jgi:kynureninase
MSAKPTGPEIHAMDAEDPLRGFRERFHIPLAADGTEAVYFTGNSLGLQPKTAREYINAELDDWARLGVEGHLHARHPWLPYHEFVAESLARVVGTKPTEVVAMNSLTVNLHLLMVSFYRPTAERYKIVIEKGAFPSDQYAVESQLAFHGFGRNGLIELTPRGGEATLRTEDILELIDREGDSIALIMLGGVNYYTGQAFDMAAITEAGHKKGCVVGFDLAHAAGNRELRLHDWNVDFAAWCTYKYLNAGPGGIAGAFVHERHARSFDLPRFAGWWGHEKETRFLMGPDFKPLAGAEGWQLSNPPIFQLAALRASLEIFDEATIPALRAKSEKLTGYLEELLLEINTDRITIITPRDPADRGCQLSLRVQNADRALFDRITERGVVADWREPDVIRVAPVPLYNTFSDAKRFSEVLADCLR